MPRCVDLSTRSKKTPSEGRRATMTGEELPCQADETTGSSPFVRGEPIPPSSVPVSPDEAGGHAHGKVRTETSGLNEPAADTGMPELHPGDVVKDMGIGKVGRVMDRVGTNYQLRPLNGGREWEAPARDLRPAVQSDAISDAVRDANAQSRRRI
ncbi:hypothetical protein ACFYT4_04000 [Streptomyces sp. NPDC004609]|uniref:hypothetical protein n=1 Tax=Streptomyces sp. NPDC004609 TaxID=3364704 RepID=UPI0036880AAB